MAYFPLVGLLIGAALAISYKILILIFPHAVTCAFIMIINVVIAGGLHIDGFIDTFDAIASGADRKRMLEIMREGRPGAVGLARCSGLVNMMVFTQMPSSLLLVTVAFAPTFPIAAMLFLLREGLVEMDVPTRQSYVMAVVRPEERTTVSGVTGLVRLAGWAVGPPLAGVAMQGVSLLAPLLTGAAMKIAYDALLWAAFRRLKPPEEQQVGSEPPEVQPREE